MRKGSLDRGGYSITSTETSPPHHVLPMGGPPGMRQQQRGTHHRIPRRSSLDTAYPPHHHRGLGTPGLGAHQRQIGAAAAVGIDSLNGGPKRTRRAASLSHVLHQVQTVYYTIRACLSVCLIFRTSGLCFLLDSPTFIHSFIHSFIQCSHRGSLALALLAAAG